MSRRVRSLWAGVLLVAAVLSGCSTLPDSGPVVVEDVERRDLPQGAPYFNPPGPAEDGSPAAIVSGFLVAMQANPLSTSVAREFLTDRARATWQPNKGTIVYEAFSVTPTTVGAKVRLSDTHRLDARGGWLGGPPGRSEVLDIRLVSEGGQWRIDNPVNALAVPTSFFDRSFARFNLYFFDQTGQVLLPDPVFIPRGEQTATNLVGGLLAGPGRRLGQITRSALPSGTTLDLSVVVTGRGVADVPLSPDVLQTSPEELSRAVDQLARTLRQVPGIERVRISVDGAPVPLSGGRIDVPVTSGAEFEAGGGETRLLAVRNGRLVDLEADAAPVPGPLGRPGFSLRSLAAMSSPGRVAGVSGDGSTVFVAPTGPEGPGQVTRPVTGGTDLLRPSYDMFGGLWVVDRTPRGARVLLVTDGGARELRVPGVTGVDVAAASIARDGSRLAVAYPGVATPTVRIVDILRTDEGIVSGPGRAEQLTLTGSETGRIVDLGWRDPGTLAVLSRPTAETSRVGYLSSDGSPSSPDLVEPTVFRGVADTMVVAPNGTAPLRLLTPDERLYTLSSNGSWPRADSRIAAASFER